MTSRERPLLQGSGGAGGFQVAGGYVVGGALAAVDAARARAARRRALRGGNAAREPRGRVSRGDSVLERVFGLGLARGDSAATAADLHARARAAAARAAARERGLARRPRGSPSSNDKIRLRFVFFHTYSLVYHLKARFTGFLERWRVFRKEPRRGGVWTL